MLHPHPPPLAVHGVLSPKWFEGSCLALARKDKTSTLLLLLSVTVKTFTIQNQGQTSDYCLAFLFKSFFLDEHVYVCSGVGYRHNERSLKQRSDSGTFPL